MRTARCVFCNVPFQDKHDFCHHIVDVHPEQIPDNVEPLEFAYALLPINSNKPMGRKCVMCKKNNVTFNIESLKYTRFCHDPNCKENYKKLRRDRFESKGVPEHPMEDAVYQRKMLYNHKNAKDYIWNDQYKFRVIGNGEVAFLDKLKSLNWDPADIFCPSPVDYFYKWDDGSVHLYIPDFFIASLQLEVEIKDDFDGVIPGREHNREIEYLKDKRMNAIASQSNTNYIKINGTKYDEFMKTYVKADVGGDVIKESFYEETSEEHIIESHIKKGTVKDKELTVHVHNKRKNRTNKIYAKIISKAMFKKLAGGTDIEKVYAMRNEINHKFNEKVKHMHFYKKYNNYYIFSKPSKVQYVWNFYAVDMSE